MGDLLLTYWLSGVFLGVSIYAIAWVMDLDRIGKFVQAVTLLFALTPIYGMIGGVPAAFMIWMGVSVSVAFTLGTVLGAAIFFYVVLTDSGRVTIRLGLSEWMIKMRNKYRRK